VTLAAEGLVVGLSVSGAEQAETIMRALEVEVAGVAPFRSVQATWNLLDPSAGRALAAAAEAGWGVIVKEAMANGRLAAATDPPVTEVAQRHEATPDQIALAAVLAQPWVDVVLSGAVTGDQLASNLGAEGLSLDGDDLARLGSIAETPERYWSTRSALIWS
jgi:aryl-alcohol dehydrogenase-like predicted oxidoreductase